MYSCDKLVKERTAMFIELVEKSDIDVTDRQNVQLKCMFQRENLRTTDKHLEIMYNRRIKLLYS